VDKTCYMCRAVATSVEHVPPRGLFPKQKDLPPGLDLRKQLLTVPSCDLHNSEKSKEDAYLRDILVMNIPNNTTAQNHFLKAVMRSYQERPALLNAIASTQVAVEVEDSTTGQRQQTLAVQVDATRLNEVFAMIARALYFHHFGKQWTEWVKIYPSFILAVTEPNAAELNAPVEQMAAYTEELMAGKPVHGENPQVFAYQVAEVVEPFRAVMRLRFYEGSHVTVIFPSSSLVEPEVVAQR
jgi:hypothetical protein